MGSGGRNLTLLQKNNKHIRLKINGAQILHQLSHETKSEQSKFISKNQSQRFIRQNVKTNDSHLPDIGNFLIVMTYILYKITHKEKFLI